MLRKSGATYVGLEIRADVNVFSRQHRAFFKYRIFQSREIQRFRVYSESKIGNGRGVHKEHRVLALLWKGGWILAT